jgi:non-specific serine/threonine protein kinase
VAEGLGNRAIADCLHLSVRTVENHVFHVLAKLGLDNRTQVAA